jgi:hypothetical protein
MRFLMLGLAQLSGPVVEGGWQWILPPEKSMPNCERVPLPVSEKESLRLASVPGYRLSWGLIGFGSHPMQRLAASDCDLQPPVLNHAVSA